MNIMIKRLLELPCNNTHDICKQLNDKIIEIYNNGSCISRELFDQYMDYLSICGNNDDKPSRFDLNICINEPHCLESLKVLFEEYLPSFELFEELLINPPYHLFKLFAHHKHKINPEYMTIYLFCSRDPKICDILTKLENIEISTSHLNMALENGNIEAFEIIINKKIPPDNETLLIATKLSYDIDVIKLIVSFGINPSIEHLEIACSTHHREIIEFYLQMDIKPNHNCFNSILAGKINYRMRRIIIRRSGSCYQDCSEKTMLIDLIIAHGYNLCYGDVLKAAKYRVKINNIQKYNFKLDERLKVICRRNNFNPYGKYLNNVKETSKGLALACGYPNNSVEIIKILSAGIEPDITHLEKVCSRRGNSIAISKMLTEGIIPTEKALLNALTHYNIGTIKLLIEHGSPVTINVLEKAGTKQKFFKFIISEYRKSLDQNNDEN